MEFINDLKLRTLYTVLKRIPYINVDSGVSQGLTVEVQLPFVSSFRVDDQLHIRLQKCRIEGIQWTEENIRIGEVCVEVEIVPTTVPSLSMSSVSTLPSLSSSSSSSSIMPNKTNTNTNVSSLPVTNTDIDQSFRLLHDTLIQYIQNIPVCVKVVQLYVRLPSIPHRAAIHNSLSHYQCTFTNLYFCTPFFAADSADTPVPTVLPSITCTISSILCQYNFEQPRTITSFAATTGTISSSLRSATNPVSADATTVPQPNPSSLVLWENSTDTFIDISLQRNKNTMNNYSYVIQRINVSIKKDTVKFFIHPSYWNEVYLPVWFLIHEWYANSSVMTDTPVIPPLTAKTSTNVGSSRLPKVDEVRGSTADSDTTESTGYVSVIQQFLSKWWNGTDPVNSSTNATKVSRSIRSESFSSSSSTDSFPPFSSNDTLVEIRNFYHRYGFTFLPETDIPIPPLPTFPPDSNSNEDNESENSFRTADENNDLDHFHSTYENEDQENIATTASYRYVMSIQCLEVHILDTDTRLRLLSFTGNEITLNDFAFGSMSSLTCRIPSSCLFPGNVDIHCLGCGWKRQTLSSTLSIRDFAVDTVLFTVSMTSKVYEGIDSRYGSIVSIIQDLLFPSPYSLSSDDNYSTMSHNPYVRWRCRNIYGIVRPSDTSTAAIGMNIHGTDYRSFIHSTATFEPKGIMMQFANRTVGIDGASITLLNNSVSVPSQSSSTIIRIQPSARSNGTVDDGTVSRTTFVGHCVMNVSRYGLQQLYGTWNALQTFFRYLSKVYSIARSPISPDTVSSLPPSSFRIQLSSFEWSYTFDTAAISSVPLSFTGSGFLFQRLENQFDIRIQESLLSFHDHLLFRHTGPFRFRFLAHPTFYQLTNIIMNNPEVIIDIPDTRYPPGNIVFPWLQFLESIVRETDPLRIIFGSSNESLFSFTSPWSLSFTNASVHWFMPNNDGTVILGIGNGEVECSSERPLFLHYCSYQTVHLHWLPSRSVRPEHSVTLTSVSYAQTLSEVGADSKNDTSPSSSLLLHGDALHVHLTFETLDQCVNIYQQIYACFQRLLSSTNQDSSIVSPVKKDHFATGSALFDLPTPSLTTLLSENYFTLPNSSLSFPTISSSLSLIHSSSNTSLVNLSSKSSESEFEDMRSIFDRWVQPFTHIENLFEPFVNKRKSPVSSIAVVSNSNVAVEGSSSFSSAALFLQRMKRLLPLLPIDTVHGFDTDHYRVSLSFLLHDLSVSIHSRLAQPNDTIVGELTLSAKENKCAFSWISTRKDTFWILPNPVAYADYFLRNGDMAETLSTLGILNYSIGSKIVTLTENLRYTNYPHSSSSTKFDTAPSVTAFSLLGHPGTLNHAYTVTGSWVLYPSLARLQNISKLINPTSTGTELIPPLTGWIIHVSYDTASIYVRGRLVEWLRALVIQSFYTEMWSKLSTLLLPSDRSSDNPHSSSFSSTSTIFYSRITLPSLTLRIDFIPEGSIRYLYRDSAGQWKCVPSRSSSLPSYPSIPSSSSASSSYLPSSTRSVRLIPIHGLHLSLPTISLSCMDGTLMVVRKILEVYTLYFTQESYRLFLSSLPSLLKTDSQVRTNQVIEYNQAYSVHSSSLSAASYATEVEEKNGVPKASSSNRSRTKPLSTRTTFSQQVYSSSVRIIKPLTTAVVTATKMIGQRTMENINQGMQALTQENEYAHDMYESTVSSKDTIAAPADKESIPPSDTNESYSLSLPREQVDQYIVLYRNNTSRRSTNNTSAGLPSNHNLVRMLATSATTVSIFATSGLSGVFTAFVSAFAGRLVYTILENSSDGQYFQSLVHYSRRRIVTTLRPYFQHTYALPFLLGNGDRTSIATRNGSGTRNNATTGSMRGDKESNENWEVL